MLKKFAVVGLVLVVAGTAALGWILNSRKREQQEAAFYRLKYGAALQECFKQYDGWLKLPAEERTQTQFIFGENWKTKTEAQILEDQRGRLQADLDKLTVGDKDVHPFANVLYGANWQKEVSDCKKRKEQNESILTASIVCASSGAVVSAWCLLWWIVRLIINELCGAWGFLAGIIKPYRKAKDETEGSAEPVANEDSKQVSQEELREKRGWLRKESKVITSSGWQGFGANSERRGGLVSAMRGGKINSDGSEFGCSVKPDGRIQNGGRGVVAALLSGEELVASGTPLIRASRNNVNTTMTQLGRAQKVQSDAGADLPKDFYKLEDSLKAQTENMEKQIAEFRQMARSVQQATLEQSKPLDGVLKELTQQVGAIREYATSQQERVKKLQEGYDWNIIRSFCLRLIRCIDNLESRISRLSEEDVEAGHLKEVRDELIFLLESSRIERFEPEINSDYRGQEKYAEAVREKECCDDPSLIGKIAEVIRAGYQYFIDDESFRVVRPAQVKLFG